jgi:hypothetical protein
VLLVIVVLLAAGAYFGYQAYQKYVTQLLTVPGCQAGTGDDAIPLDFGQAADAATLAGVAAREGLPARALTVAYATAFQESKLENLTYGDRDSVGIFQQRPSQGWGTREQLTDPAFASAAFFGALVKVPHWQTIPVDQAAQAVQKSADGSAYQQYAGTGAQLAAFLTVKPHALTCWYNPTAQAASQNVSPKLHLDRAVAALKDAFGAPGRGQVVTDLTQAAPGTSMTLHAAPSQGWVVANWLVAHASLYGITKVSYHGYQWSAKLTETSWQAGASGTAGGIVAS